MKTFTPKALWLLLIILPISAIYIVRFKEGLKDLRSIYRNKNTVVLEELYSIRYILTSIFFILFIVFAVLSMAGFSWKNEHIPQETRGLDVVFAVDVSRSMLASDIQPSRLDKVKTVVNTLILDKPDIRYSLVAFKGKAEILMPLTEDLQSVRLAVGNLSPGISTSTGTDLSDGIQKALQAFPGGKQTTKVVFIFSDGMDQKITNKEDIISFVKQTDLYIYSIVCGSKTGSTIPLSGGKLVRDADGNIVIAGTDESPLKDLSDIGGGELYYLSDLMLTGRLRNLVLKNYIKIGQKGFRAESKIQYRLFLGLSLMFLFIFILSKSIKWKRVI